MISASTAAAWSAVRWSPAQTASIARVTTSFGITRPPRSGALYVPADAKRTGSSSGLQEVGQQMLALRGEHRLGVELDALGGQLAVAGAHHDVAEAGAQLELVGQVGVGDQRVVAAGDQRAGQAGVDRSGRRARPRRPCRGSARPARCGRRRPRPATGGRGRRRAPACPPRRSARIASTEIPASAGVQGPGETTRRSAPRSSSSPTSALSLRTTSISAPSSPRYWTRL